MECLLLLRFRPERTVDLDANKRSVQFLESVQKFIESSRGKGIMIFDAAFQDGTGAMSILRAENEKALKNFVTDIPFREILDFELIALEDSMESIQKQKELLEVKK